MNHLQNFAHKTQAAILALVSVTSICSTSSFSMRIVLLQVLLFAYVPQSDLE